MNLKLSLLSILMGTILVPTVQAQQPKKSKLTPLFFEAERNGLKILPQRFEYTLLDDYKLKIGDVLVNTEVINFSLAPAKKGEGYDLTFNWPLHLFEEGELALKNNAGKAILTANFTKKDLKFVGEPAAHTNKTNPNSETPNIEADSPEEVASQEQLRGDLAAFVVPNVSKTIVDDLKYLPYMSFCVMRQSSETRLYLCSNELFMATENGQMIIKNRSPRRTQSQIDINGKTVGEQGMIYLNDRNENISFRSLSKYGSTVEIDTRMKDVDFIDVVSSDDEKFFVITASGAEPVEAKNIKRESNDTWRGRVYSQRPQLYLKSDGDIPLRQEFYITKPLPKNSQRVYISSKTNPKTYSSSVTISGVATPQVKIQRDAQDKNSVVQTSEKNNFKWTISDLLAGSSERRFIELHQGNEVFYAGYNIFRGYPFMLGVSAQTLTSSEIANAVVKGQWWAENFLGFDSDTFKFHWGMDFNFTTAISKPTGIDTYQILGAGLLWRAHSGLNFIDPTWGLRLGYSQLTVNNEALGSPELGIYTTNNFQTFLKNYLDWYTLSLNYTLGAKSDNLEFGYGAELKGTIYKRLSNRWLINAALLYEMTDWKTSNQEKSNTGLEAGLNFQF